MNDNAKGFTLELTGLGTLQSVYWLQAAAIISQGSGQQASQIASRLNFPDSLPASYKRDITATCIQSQL